MRGKEEILQKFAQPPPPPPCGLEIESQFRKLQVLYYLQ